MWIRYFLQPSLANLSLTSRLLNYIKIQKHLSHTVAFWNWHLYHTVHSLPQHILLLFSVPNLYCLLLLADRNNNTPNHQKIGRHMFRLYKNRKPTLKTTLLYCFLNQPMSHLHKHFGNNIWNRFHQDTCIRCYLYIQKTEMISDNRVLCSYTILINP